MSEEQTQTTAQQDDDAAQKAQEAEEKHEAAKAKMEEIEKDPPENLEDWPDDEAKYQTFGGAEDGESTYDDKHEEALGEHSVRHHEDGSVEVKGDKAENPDDYKGDPIPGGPTDPNSPDLAGEREKEESGEDSYAESRSDG